MNALPTGKYIHILKVIGIQIFHLVHMKNLVYFCRRV